MEETATNGQAALTSTSNCVVKNIFIEGDVQKFHPTVDL